MRRTRRGRGEGGVFQRESDSQWVGTISLGYDANTGKRKRKTVYGTTKAEVLAKLDKLRNDARTGTTADAGSLTVGQFLAKWLAAGTPGKKGKAGVKTLEVRESSIRIHLTPHVGPVKLAKLSPLHIESLYASLQMAGAGPGAIRYAADVLSIALNHAVKLKLIPSNPSAAIPKPIPPKRDMLFLTAEQSKAILTTVAGKPVFPIVVTALATGCRQGELLALGWEDIDLRKGTLIVRRSLAQTKGGYVLKEPKTHAGLRSISLPVFAVEALAAHRTGAVKAGLMFAPVFCTRTGGHLDKKNVLRAFRVAVNRTNGSMKSAKDEIEPKPIPAKIRFHDLRHTHASLLLSAGHSLKAVSRRLGHADPAMTLRVYAHCLPNDDDKLADGLNGLMT